MVEGNLNHKNCIIFPSQFLSINKNHLNKTIRLKMKKKSMKQLIIKNEEMKV